jgi:hypothetical protein
VFSLYGFTLFAYRKPHSNVFFEEPKNTQGARYFCAPWNWNFSLFINNQSLDDYVSCRDDLYYFHPDNRIVFFTK